MSNSIEKQEEMEVIKKGKIPENITSKGNSEPVSKSLKLTPEEWEQAKNDIANGGFKSFTEYVKYRLFNCSPIYTLDCGHEILVKLAECADLLTDMGEKISPADTADFNEVVNQFAEIERGISHVLDCINVIKNSGNVGKEVV